MHAELPVGSPIRYTGYPGWPSYHVIGAIGHITGCITYDTGRCYWVNFHSPVHPDVSLPCFEAELEPVD